MFFNKHSEYTNKIFILIYTQYYILIYWFSEGVDALTISLHEK